MLSNWTSLQFCRVVKGLTLRKLSFICKNIQTGHSAPTEQIHFSEWMVVSKAFIKVKIQAFLTDEINPLPDDKF